MSTFTLVHHTNPAIPFTPPEQWHEAQAQLMGTVHCDYPAWVEFLCHDINVHIPHHISTAIPSYKLRQAHQVIKTYWGDHCQETRFSWALLWAVTTQCHLYDRADYYRTFEAHHNRTP
jgi:omega-6 fatty acid desaturase (delta-12 desaturase)